MLLHRGEAVPHVGASEAHQASLRGNQVIQRVVYPSF